MNIYDTLREKLWLRVVIILAVAVSLVVALVWETGSLQDRSYIIALIVFIGRFFVLPLVFALIIGAIAGWIAFSWRRAWTIGRRSYAIGIAFMICLEVWGFMSPSKDQQLLFLALAGGAFFIMGSIAWNWPSDVEHQVKEAVDDTPRDDAESRS